MVEFHPEQLKAVSKLRNRAVLRADVGSGKSRIGLYWYLRDCGGDVVANGHGEAKKPENPRPLYIITPAVKRDTLEWETELALFGMMVGEDGGWANAPIVVDSWHNIHKYTKVHGATFLFDEQKLVGSGKWVKSFYQIARKNRWIVMTATPGDDWKDYIPLFVANGFYRSKAEFLRRHAVYNAYANYPKIDRWIETERLDRLRMAILVEVEYSSHTKKHMLTVPVDYDEEKFKTVKEDRWNPWENRPIQDAGELYRLMRRVSNEHPSRLQKLVDIQKSSPRLIVFYNFDYELESLRTLGNETGVVVAERNGHKHMPVPTTKSWFYLVQYTAGAEAWNCISTGSVAFYSLTYSWKAFKQAMGRVDRYNTPFEELHYHVLRNQSVIDNQIWECLGRKKTFNERQSMKKLGIDPESFPGHPEKGL